MIAAAANLTLAERAGACPFCSAQQAQTLREEMESADVFLVARSAQDAHPIAPDGEVPLEIDKTTFDVVDILKGRDLLGDVKQVEVVYFGQQPRGTLFYLVARDAPQLRWESPIPILPAAADYIRQLPRVAKREVPERLEFYLKFLEHEDQIIAADSFDEFARADYDQVGSIGDKLDRQWVLDRVNDPQVSAVRRGLFLVLLGLCGTPEDADALENKIRGDDREIKPGLDALLSCFLVLRGPDGLSLVDEMFLSDEEASYGDTYAALQALRFHGQSETVIPRPRLLESLRLVLERPKLADLVIPDLARWEDWSVMDRLVVLFRDADEKSTWLRVPVVHYLQVCPLPEAKVQLAALEKLDPETVERALEFMPDLGTDQVELSLANAKGAGANFKVVNVAPLSTLR